MAKHDLIAVLPQGKAGLGRIRILASIADRPEWAVEVLLLATAAGPEVLELRVRPRGGGSPAGGISTRLMREINVGELIDIGRDCARSEEAAILAMADAPMPDLDVSVGFREEVSTSLRKQAETIGALSQEKKRSGPRGNGIDHYLDWAVRYAEKVAAGVRNPNAVLAKESGNSADYVRDTITDARRRYLLLTPNPGRGRAGGTLTQKALDLLEQRQHTED